MKRRFTSLHTSSRLLVALRRPPTMSVFVPLLGDKQTSVERVENDASDPFRKSNVRIFHSLALLADTAVW
jgi:hypothetical protein